MAHPAAPSIYGSRPGPQTALLLGLMALAIGGGAAAQVAPPPPPPPTSPSSDLAQRTLAAGQAMERSATALAGQGQPADRERACSAFYLAQVAYARAVELGINSAEAEIDRVETLKQSLGCEASATHAPAGPSGP